MSPRFDSELVETRYGPLRGKRLPNGVTAWYGVRYANVKERWTAPEALSDGFRYEEDCTQYAPAAYQPPLSMLPMTLQSPQAILGPPEQTFAEDCLTLDIYRPPHCADDKLPVTVYIHGGFLNTGSPLCHLNEPTQVIAVDDPRIWVCVTYRLGVFGFLAADSPRLSGNFGFLDQWQALLWVQRNIAAFGGSPDNVTLMGQSAGAHSTQLHMHFASRLPDDQPIPFQQAVMISNGIGAQPKTLKEAQKQFDALCEQLNLDTGAADIMDRLRALPADSLTSACAALKGRGAFRQVTDGVFVPSDLLEWQTSGHLAASLARKGFRRLVIGETVDEELGGACPSYDFLVSLATFTYGEKAGQTVVKHSAAYDGMTTDELSAATRFVLSSMQVYLGARKLAKAIWQEPSIEVIRYVIAHAPGKAIPLVSPLLLVSHGTDLAMWFHRDEYMTPEEVEIARKWRKAIYSARRAPSERHHLMLAADGQIKVEEDPRWHAMQDLDRLLCA